MQPQEQTVFSWGLKEQWYRIFQAFPNLLVAGMVGGFLSAVVFFDSSFISSFSVSLVFFLTFH